MASESEMRSPCPRSPSLSTRWRPEPQCRTLSISSQPAGRVNKSHATDICPRNMERVLFINHGSNKHVQHRQALPLQIKIPLLSPVAKQHLCVCTRALQLIPLSGINIYAFFC